MPLSRHADDCRLVLIQQVDRRFTLDESWFARSVDDQAIGMRRVLFEDRNRGGVLPTDGRDGQCQCGSIPVVADWFEAIATGQTRSNHLWIDQAVPDDGR